MVLECCVYSDISVLFIIHSWIFRYGVLFISWSTSNRWMWLWKICSPDRKYVREHVRGFFTRLLNLSDTLIVSKLFQDESFLMTHTVCLMHALEKIWELHTNSGSSELSLTTVWPRLTTVNREIPLKWIEWYLLRFRITWKSSTKI